jgi:hypothetical protein
MAELGKIMKNESGQPMDGRGEILIRDLTNAEKERYPLCCDGKLGKTRGMHGSYEMYIILFDKLEGKLRSSRNWEKSRGCCIDIQNLYVAQKK